MFGTQIEAITLIYIVIQGVLLLFFLFFYFGGLRKSYNKRYLLLTFFFFLYNLVSGLMPDDNIPISLMSQDFIAWTVGITCAVYFLHYLMKEFHVISYKYLKTDLIVKALSLNFLLLFIIPYSITESLIVSRFLFLILPAFIAVYCFVNLMNHFRYEYCYAKNQFYRNKMVLGILALISVIAFPFTILIFGDNQVVEHSVLNSGFLFISLMLILKRLYVSNINTLIENNTKHNEKLNERLNITYTEKDILFLMLNNPELDCKSLSEEYSIDKKVICSLSNKIFNVLNNLNGDNSSDLEYTIYKKIREFNFSQREIEIIELLLKKMSYYEIAEELSISYNTVSKHCSNIFKKTNSKNKKELIALFTTESV